MDSTSNIHRRYNLLFTLPSRNVAVALGVFSGLLVLLLARLPVGLGIGVSSLDAAAPGLFIAMIFLSVGLEMFLLRGNPVATFRRLVIIAAISNLLWALMILIGFVVSFLTSSPQKFYSFLLFGMFSAIALKTIVLGSVFFDDVASGFAVAFIQPFAQLFALTMWNPMYLATIQVTVTILGMLFAVACAMYLAVVNRTGKSIIKRSPLKMLRAFLHAWAENKPKLFEDIFEEESSTEKVKTKIISFEGDGKPVVVVPEIHPGPFYPIGSSNIPYELQVWFSSKGYSPLVLHGVSGHDLNLPSRTSVEKFLASLEDLRTIGAGKTCTMPMSITVGKATVTGMAFGDFAFVIITLAPHGMEDFPRTVKETIERKALELGYKGAFVIDAHNSLGETPNKEECDATIEAAATLLQKLLNVKQKPFKIGHAQSSELQASLKPDIGPAGIGVIVFEIENAIYTLLSIDSNNASMGFREKLVQEVSKEQLNLIEMCTTDTHFNAAKVMNENGYVALGEITQVGETAAIVREHIKRASSRMAQSGFNVSVVEVEVKVIGEKLLADFSIILDRVTAVAKRGGIALVVLGAVVTIITAIL
ncbi:MAG: DUF2070 family protein [Thaumarchaeota archaeon]|nr:DUF2070 family protein [Nitrososphaerota archaeon]